MEVRWLVVVLSIGCGSIVSPMKIFPQSAQPPRGSPPSATVKEREMVKRGEVVFSKHCPICHLGRPAETRPFIGRNLRGILKNAKPHQEAAVREFIRKGSDKMPGFQYNLTPTQIDDLMSYLKTYN